MKFRQDRTTGDIHAPLPKHKKLRKADSSSKHGRNKVEGDKKMVAISLYRGNLHKVPDVPRRWLMPKHTISIQNFKSLLRKREKALSLLLPPPSNPNPNPNFSTEEENHEFVGDNGCSKQNNLQIAVYQPPQLPPIDDPVKEIVSKEIEIEKDKERDGKDQSRSEGLEEKRKGIGDCGVPELAEMTQKEDDEVTAIEIKSTELQKSENEKKKIDLEEKLKDLNERKHKLVQMLKQILNAEEEIKRRGNIVISAPSASQQVDAATNVLNKIGAEAAANCFTDLKGESEDDNNNNTNVPQSNQQQTLLNSPTTPSQPPSSPLQKLSHASSLSLTPAEDPSPTSRPCQATTTTTTTSSACIAPPSGNPPLGNSTPILSTMSATHCTTSSPSPVASGGTSVFRDPRITSPSWS